MVKYTLTRTSTIVDNKWKGNSIRFTSSSIWLIDSLSCKVYVWWHHVCISYICRTNCASNFKIYWAFFEKTELCWLKMDRDFDSWGLQAGGLTIISIYDNGNLLVFCCWLSSSLCVVCHRITNQNAIGKWKIEFIYKNTRKYKPPWNELFLITMGQKHLKIKTNANFSKWAKFQDSIP